MGIREKGRKDFKGEEGRIVCEGEEGRKEGL